MINDILLGDCLDVLPTLAAESVMVTYIDPPYMTGRKFDGFRDDYDLPDYLRMMAAVFGAVRRVMAPDGTVYVHIAPPVSHRVRILLDDVFGAAQYRSTIAFRRWSAHNDARRNVGKVHDDILIYARGRKPKFHQQFLPYRSEYEAGYYRHEDDRGRYRTSSMTIGRNSAGTGYRYEWRGITREWTRPRSEMARMDAAGEITYSTNGFPRIKKYLRDAVGTPLGDVWDDLPFGSNHPDRTGYPTQKPVGLLRRIIRLSSDPGDVVLDPMMGSGTTCAAAKTERRGWVGIDRNPRAVEIARARLERSASQMEIIT